MQCKTTLELGLSPESHLFLGFCMSNLSYVTKHPVKTVTVLMSSSGPGRSMMMMIVKREEFKGVSKVDFVGYFKVSSRGHPYPRNPQKS